MVPSWHESPVTSINSFRMNTYKSLSKQTTLTPFRINTYEKQGGRVLWLTRSLLGQCLEVRSFKRVPTYPVTSDSHVMTDDHPGYGGLGKHFRRHSTIRGILGRFTPAKKVMS